MAKFAPRGKGMAQRFDRGLRRSEQLKPISLSDEQFNYLAKDWKVHDTQAFNATLHRITGEQATKSHSTKEVEVFVSDQCIEPRLHLSKLVAYGHGVVVFDSTSTAFPEYSGIITNHIQNPLELYKIRCFNRFAKGLVYSSEFPKINPEFSYCPAWIYLKFDPGDPIKFGFEPTTWAKLNKWLTRWLSQ